MYTENGIFSFSCNEAKYYNPPTDVYYIHSFGPRAKENNRMIDRRCRSTQRVRHNIIMYIIITTCAQDILELKRFTDADVADRPAWVGGGAGWKLRVAEAGAEAENDREKGCDTRKPETRI